VAAVAVLALQLGACEWPGTDDLQTSVITNETARTIVVYIDYPDRPEIDIMRLRSGESGTTNFGYPIDPCSAAPLIVRTTSGVEVARRETLCVGDKWVVSQD
jgi:hypothetical protein